MPMVTSGASLRRLPLFFAYCPDRAGVLQQRLKVRPEHWKRWQEDTNEGLSEFGLGYLPPPSETNAPPAFTLPEGIQPMAGSLLLFRSTSLSAAWDRVRADIYWTAGVWDREAVRVHEFIRHELINDGMADDAGRPAEEEPKNARPVPGKGEEGEVGLS